MKVLVACEESQTVCKAFRMKGHEAYSCDIIECSGGHHEWHIQGDALAVLNPTQHCTPVGDVFEGIEFKTVDGVAHTIQPKWDLIIAHPPCTYLCMSGQKHCNIETYGEKAKERIKERDKAIEFFMQFVNADCEKIAIENPVGIMTRNYRKADQYIQPLQFGHPTSKKTGLWLKGLPKLVPTNIVEQEFHTSSTGRKWDKWFWESSLIHPLSERSKFRSKTFEGIAEAMAEQWGGETTEKEGADNA
jgi:hypothetical protein